ncbi:MAG: hypothetical protein QHG99_04650 [Methanomicrobiales archaeon]|nr:hypothetical protein [Methanomicrobiales archaeon]
MQESNEYLQVLQYLYRKSLILHDTSDFHPVLYFFFIDSLAHIDYTVSVLAFNFQSIRNEMTREYLRWRIDQEQIGARVHFPEFINWLKERDRDKFDSLPVVWTLVYDDDSEADYRSFRFVIDPDANRPLPASFFYSAIDEFFENEFLKSLYNGASLARLFDEFVQSKNA